MPYIPITADILTRIKEGRVRLQDPCVICGEPLNLIYEGNTVKEGGHIHTLSLIEEVIRRAKKLTKRERDAIMKRGAE
jgi:hypothetical protein